MELSEIAQTVRQIKKSLFKKFGHHTLGMMKSHMKGIGMQFKEHKIYVHGDDLRFIDWKVLAKTQTPYIKTFEQERNIEILILIDASMSMLVGFKGVSKLQAALDIAYCLYFLSADTKDKVHAVVLGDEVLDIPLSSGEKGLVTLVGRLKKSRIIDDNGRVLRSYSPQKDSSPEEKYRQLLKIGIKRKEIVLLSDFYHFLTPEALERLVIRGNVYPIRIQSPLEEMKRFPFEVFGKVARNTSPPGKLFRTPQRGDGKGQGNKRCKFIELKVDRNYLEDFVEEMRR